MQHFLTIEMHGVFHREYGSIKLNIYQITQSVPLMPLW